MNPRRWLVTLLARAPALFHFLLATSAPLALDTAQPLHAHAQQTGDTLQLSIDDALRIGFETRPDLRAARAGIDEALGGLRQSRILPFNPMAEAKASRLISPGSNSPLEIIFSQEIEWAGQRGLRASSAASLVEASEARLADAARLAYHDIITAWYGAAGAALRHRIRLRSVALETRIREAVEAQAREGQVSMLDLNLARINAGQVAAAERADRLARNTTRLALARALGLAPETAVRPIADTIHVDSAKALDADSLTALALRTRPDLAAMTALVESARTRRRLFGRAAIPNLVLGGVAQRALPGQELDWGLRLGFSVPVWNRNQGLRDAATAQVARLEAERAGIENGLRTEVRAALIAWQAARETLATLESQVVEPARANQDLVGIAYTEGQLDLPTTLVLQTQLIEAELAFVDAWLAERKAAAALDAATGTRRR